jgi:serine/threonine protein kinase
VDVFSLGCVLCELFTGEVLLRNESAQSALARVIGIFGPLDPDLLRRGKLARELLTAAGMPYERVFGDVSGRRVRVLRPKRTSLAARLGLPPLGAAIRGAAPFAEKKTDLKTNPVRDDGVRGLGEPRVRHSRADWTRAEEKDGFLEFLLLLLQPNPARRATAAEALRHPWLAGAGDDFDFDFDDETTAPDPDLPVEGNDGRLRGDTRVRDMLAQL